MQNNWHHDNSFKTAIKLFPVKNNFVCRAIPIFLGVIQQILRHKIKIISFVTEQEKLQKCCIFTCIIIFIQMLDLFTQWERLLLTDILFSSCFILTSTHFFDLLLLSKRLHLMYINITLKSLTWPVFALMGSWVQSPLATLHVNQFEIW